LEVNKKTAIFAENKQNTIWGSLCGDYDDDRAFDSTDADKIYGPILALGTSIIQTDRPEFLIDYLKHKGRR
jgi:glycerophosphoryl diester phosphodiesterase